MRISESIIEDFKEYYFPVDEFTFKRLQTEAVPLQVTIYTVPNSNYCDIELAYDGQDSHNAETLGSALMMVGSVFAQFGNAHASLVED